MSELIPWDEEKHIYYVIGDFTGRNIYPGGQSAHRAEVQFRLSAPEGTKFWDNSNDFSYKDVEKKPGETPLKTDRIPVYDDGVLVAGIEPEKKPVEVLIGDVNNDKKINILDYTLLKKYINNDGEGVEINTEAADINNDEKVNFLDLLTLKSLI